MKWSKNKFWELSLDWIQEDFNDDEKLAVSYLTEKFWYEVTEDIKERVRIQLITDWINIIDN